MARLASESLLGVHLVEYIPNGLDLKIFRPLDKATSRATLGIPQSSMMLCFGAEYLNAPRKGGAVLLAALEMLPLALKNSLILLTFGHRMPELRNLGITTIELGYLDSDRLKPLVYSAADIFVLPSMADNLPLVLQEAMACGTPLIGFDVGGIRDLVRHGETGLLVNPGDGEALSDAILAIIEDGARRRFMGQRCIDIAKNEFDVIAQANSYADLYARIVG